MIPTNILPDLCDAWREGGRRAFCYLEAAWLSAVLSGQFKAACEYYWLLAVLWEKTSDEVLGGVQCQ